MKPVIATAIAPAELNFIEAYIEYTSQTECPTFFHRWTAIASLAAFLGRRIYFNHGHFTIHPNIYAMLIGSPGTKKSSAIKIGAKLLKQAGYETFAAKKTRQEKFLLDLAEPAERYLAGTINADEDSLDQAIFGTSTSAGGDPDNRQMKEYIGLPPCETFVAADEFNNFIGLGNLDFAAILGELWDYEDIYDYRLKNSKSVFIPYPTVTILGGNTPTGFAQAFPTEAIGQGFFSRLLLIYGEPSGVRHTFPPPPDIAKQDALVDMLDTIKSDLSGEVTMTPEAIDLMDLIYQNDPGIDDIRFEHYANRRLTHLIKLCLVCAAARISQVIDTEDIIHANTILSFTEKLMPKALGEFGKAKNAEVAHKVMNLIAEAHTPIKQKDIWKLVHKDLDKLDQLQAILGNLQVAEKIQVIKGGGYLPIKKIHEEALEGTVNWNILTLEERNLL